MICSDFQSYSIVEDKGFRNFVYNYTLDLWYKLSSKHKAKKNYINKKYNKDVIILKRILLQTEYVTITCDT